MNNYADCIATPTALGLLISTKDVFRTDLFTQDLLKNSNNLNSFRFDVHKSKLIADIKHVRS